MPRPEVLRLGGTASATASNGTSSIIATSTMRKWKLARIALRRACGSERIAAEPAQFGDGELLGAVAAAAEILDRRHVDRQIVLRKLSTRGTR